LHAGTAQPARRQPRSQGAMLAGVTREELETVGGVKEDD
jgi:hypothetical protein